MSDVKSSYYLQWKFVQHNHTAAATVSRKSAPFQIIHIKFSSVSGHHQSLSLSLSRIIQIPFPSNMAPSTPDLPSAADHSERLNRMNMVLAKHSSTLAALKRPKPSSTSSQATVTKAADSRKATKSSFSALKNSSASDPAAAPPNDASKTQQRVADDDDDDDNNFSSINSGIGFVPAGKEIVQNERSAATRDLRGKLLGKRAREQKEDAAALRKKKKGGRVEDDESDEDEGRSKIGKGRQKGRSAKKVEDDE